jgi:FtsP/CotA-like multicopper oxidase with cupredoxin domain
MFYHDHAEAITRLNVYVGEATGYVVTDQTEQDMISGTNVTGVNPNGLQVLPGIGIPLVIQDKTFVDNTTIAYQDPTWNAGTDYANVSGAKVPMTGDLWVPHVYMPGENPWDPSGVNAFGRWPYAPWEFPERTGTHGPIENIYYDPLNRPWEPLLTPGTPNPSMVPEAFEDTPMVNGALYPYVPVEPKAYRFRILSAADDRFYNLNLYRANTTIYTNSLGIPTELDLIPNPDTSNDTNSINPVVVNPADAGPSFIKIGTDGGFLPHPVVVPPQPTTYDASGNVLLHGLALGPAERADVIVNFSGFAGQDLILYNDAPTPWPGASGLYDFYTGNSDQTSSGGAPPTLPGYGPNTRTLMVFRVGTTVTTPTPDVNLANLNAVFAKTPGKNGVFEVSADEIPVPMSAYNSAYNAAFPDNFVNAVQSTISYNALMGYPVSNFPITDKELMDAFPDAYDEFGRLIGLLGLWSPGGPTGTIFELYGYTSPPIDFIQASIHGAQIGSTQDGTQIWRIRHSGTDTHPIHWHLYTVQPINRINATDNSILPIPDDEIGWRETLRISPVQDTIIALRPYSTNLPFDLPNSHRNISPNTPAGTIIEQGPGGWGFLDIIGQPINVVNKAINYGGEFVFHCHILGHEEGDMMHAVVFGDYPNAPLNLTVSNNGNFSNPIANLSWIDNSMDETNWTIQRATNISGPWTDVATIPSTTEVFMGMTVNYIDNTVVSNTTYYFRVLATNIMGDTTTYPNNVPFPTLTVNSTPSNVVLFFGAPHDMVGSFLSGVYYLDYNGNFTWDGAPPDLTFPWTGPGFVPIAGDWNNTGLDYIGSYSNGTFYLDYNGNFTWDGPVVDRVFGWTGPGWEPVIGDWNGDGKVGIGTYSSGIFILDYNDNFLWDGPAVDKLFWWTTAGWTPVVGDWNGNGNASIGTYNNGTFILDYNDNFLWDGTPTDKMFTWTGPGFVPVIGDWNGNGASKVGTYSAGTFVLDVNGNFLWDGAPPDAIFLWTGVPYVPVVGDWNGDGKDGVGTFSGFFYLDYNDNYIYDPLIDKAFPWTTPAYTPIIGKWSFA